MDNTLDSSYTLRVRAMQIERAKEEGYKEIAPSGTNEAGQDWDVGRDIEMKVILLTLLVRAGGDEALRACSTGQTLWVGCGSAHSAFGLLPGGERWECARDAFRTRPG